MTYIEGILPKGPYLPCESMAGRALLAGYHRHVSVNWTVLGSATFPEAISTNLATNFTEIWPKIQQMSFMKNYLKMLSANHHPFLFRPQCVMQSGRLFTSKRRWQQNDLNSLRNSTQRIGGHSVHQWAYLWWSGINCGGPKKYVNKLTITKMI